MKTEMNFDVKVNDRKAIRKMQRLVLILERLATMLDDYKHIQIEISVVPRKKKWWQLW
jgi:hypothetical protein